MSTILFCIFQLILLPRLYSLKNESFCYVYQSSTPLVYTDTRPGPCTGKDIFLIGKYLQIGVHVLGNFGSNDVYSLSNSPSRGKRIGLLSDFDRNGFFSSPLPTYAGDYHALPLPYEAWMLEWRDSNNQNTRTMNAGVYHDYNFIEIWPNVSASTSTVDAQSMMFIGKQGHIKIGKITKFQNDQQFVMTTVTIINEGDSPIYDFYYKREHMASMEYTAKRLTRINTYVKYQPAAADGSDCCLPRTYINPTYPQAACVMATGINYYSMLEGMGAVNPHVRVAHNYMFAYPSESYTDLLWTGYGGNDVQPKASYKFRMLNAQIGVMIIFKFDTIAPGEVVQFTYFQMFNNSYLNEALQNTFQNTISQPTYGISGNNSLFSVLLTSTDYKKTKNKICQFYIFAKNLTFNATATWYYLGRDDTRNTETSQNEYSINFNSLLFQNGDVQIKAIIESNNQADPIHIDKTAFISNTGIPLCFINSDNNGSYIFYSDEITVLEVDFCGGNYSDYYLYDQVDGSDFWATNYSTNSSSSTYDTWNTSTTSNHTASFWNSTYIGNMTTNSTFNSTPSAQPVSVSISILPVTLSVSFYEEVYWNNEMTSKLIETQTSPPFRVQITPNASAWSHLSKVYIRAEVTTSDGSRGRTTTVFSGISYHIHPTPTDIILSSLFIQERSPVGQVIGYFNTSDDDSGIEFQYKLLESSSGLVTIEGNELKVAGVITYPYIANNHTLQIRVRSSTGQIRNCCITKDFNISVLPIINLAPIGISPTAINVMENTTIPSLIGELLVIDPDHSNYYNLTLLGDQSTFTIDYSGKLFLRHKLNSQITPQYSLVVQVEDYSYPTQVVHFPIDINIIQVDVPPSDLTLSCDPCVVNANLTAGMMIGSFMATDIYMNNTFYYYLSDSLVTKDVVHLSNATGSLTVGSKSLHRMFSYALPLSVTAVNRRGLSFTKDFVVQVVNRQSPYSSNSTCYCESTRETGLTVTYATSSSLLTPSCRVNAESRDGSPLSYSILTQSAVGSGESGNGGAALGGLFVLSSCSGVLYVNQSLDSFQANATIQLTVLVASYYGSGVITYLTVHVVKIFPSPDFSDTILYLDERKPVDTVVCSNLTYLIRYATSGGCHGCLFSILAGNVDGYFKLTNNSMGTLAVAQEGLEFSNYPMFALTMRVVDPHGKSAVGVVTVEILEVPLAPVLPPCSGSYGSVLEHTAVGTPVGSGIIAARLSPRLHYRWSITGGDRDGVWRLASEYSSVLGTNVTQLLVASPNISYDMMPVYRLQITIAAYELPYLNASAMYTVQVVDVHEPPLLPPHFEFTVLENSTRLSPVGHPLVDSWSDPDTDDTAVFYITKGGSDDWNSFAVNSSTGQFIQLQLKFNVLLKSTFEYVVTVYDRYGLSVTTSVTISVIPVLSPPVFVYQPYSGYIISNSNHDEKIVSVSSELPLQYTATDNHHTKLRFTVVAVDGDTTGFSSSLFYCIQNDNESFFIASNHSFDYKQQSVHTVTIAASSSLYVTEQDFRVYIQDVNSKPSIVSSLSCYVSAYASVGTPICTVVGLDEDSASNKLGWGTLTYSLLTPVEGIEINTTNNLGMLWLSDVTSSWFSAGSSIPLVVVVRDGGGMNASGIVTVTSITKEKSTASLRCPSDMYANISGNATVGSVVYSMKTSADVFRYSILGGNADRLFALNTSTGTLTLAKKPVYGFADEQYLILQLTENSDTPLTITCGLTITVIPMKIPPVFPSAIRYTDEHIRSGHSLTVNQVQSEPLVVNYVSSPTGNFSLLCVSCGNNPIEVEAATGLLKLRDGYTLNYATLNRYSYWSNWTDGTYFLSAKVDIIVLNIPDAPIVLSSSFTISENATVGTVVGYVNAIDYDYQGGGVGRLLNFTTDYCGERCELVYVLLTGGYGAFSLDPFSGQIAVTNNGLDFEDRTEYNLTVKVTDSSGSSGYNSIHISVRDRPDCHVTTMTSSGGVAAWYNMSTAGAETLVIRGVNFGPTKQHMSYYHLKPQDVTITARLQDHEDISLSTYSYWMTCSLLRTSLHDNTALNCTTPAGVGAFLGVQVTVDVLYPTSGVTRSCTTPLSQHRVSYAPPVIIAAVSQSVSIPSRGGTQVLLSGRNFGPMSTFVVLHYSNIYFSDTVQCSVTTSDVQLSCTLGAGIGSALELRAVVGGQTSNTLSPSSIGYASPVIYNVTGGQSMSTCGGGVDGAFIVSGDNFGSGGTDIVVTYGWKGLQYTASCVLSIPHTILQCMSSTGVGGSLFVSVTVGDLTTTSPYPMLSYASPTITSLSGQGAKYGATTGGDVVYLTGNNLGPMSLNASLLSASCGPTGSEYQAAHCKVFVANKVIQCFTSPGSGSNHTWKLVIAGQTSAPSTSRSSYAYPVINSFSGSGSSAASTHGGQVVDIHGLNFGESVSEVDSVSYAAVGYTVKYDVTASCDMVTPHTLLRCTTAPGVGSQLLWTVVVSGQSSALPATSYAPPVIHTVALVGSREDMSVTGGQLVIITGQNFGPIPNSTAALSSWSTSRWSPQRYLDSVTYGATGIEYLALSCNVTADTTLYCFSAAGVGAELVWVVTVGGQSSAVSTATMSYGRPSITSFSSPAVVTDGGPVTVYGSGFSDVSNSYQLYVDNHKVPCYITSSTSLSFLVPPSPYVSNSVSARYISVVMGGQTVSSTLNYTTPHITSIHTVILTTFNGTAASSSNGTINIVILGVSFSLNPIVRVRDNQSVLRVLSCFSKSHTEVICPTSLKYGNVSVQVGATVSNWRHFQYGDPMVLHTTMIEGTARTEGNTKARPAVLQVTGQFFTTSTTAPLVEIVDVNGAHHLCRQTSYLAFTAGSAAWMSALQSLSASSAEAAGVVPGLDISQDVEQITCELPVGQGSQNTVLVTRGVTASATCGCITCSPAACFSYSPPVILSRTPATGSTAGGYEMVLRGDGFGLSAQIRMNGVPLTVRNSTHNVLHVTVPPGQGQNLKLVVVAGDQSSEQNTHQANDTFSYSPPIILSVDGAINYLAHGVSVINITGRNFGEVVPIVYFGSTSLVVRSHSHTRLVVYLPPTVSRFGYMTVNVSGRLAVDHSFRVTPPSPVIHRVSPSVIDTAGGRATNTTVTLFGEHLGSSFSSTILFVGKYAVAFGDVVSYNDTHITFFAPPGAGRQLPINISNDGLIYVNTAFTLSYSAPFIAKIDIIGSAVTSGGFTLRLLGSSFGSSTVSTATVTVTDPTVSSDSLESRVYQPVCQVYVHLDEEIRCLAPAGIGQHLLVAVNVSGQAAYADYSYAPPTISSIRQSDSGDAAGGETLLIYGDNFGTWRTNVTVLIGDRYCAAVVWLADSPANKYKPYLKCTTVSTTVGSKNVSVSIGGQWSMPYTKYSVSCKEGWYGGLGEVCQYCGSVTTTGLACSTENLARPAAASGYYLLTTSSATTSSLSSPAFCTTPTSCVLALPCDPPSACMGNNTCASIYSGIRCAECASGYYRLDRQCQLCPSTTSIAALLSVVIVIILLMCWFYKYLEKKRICLTSFTLTIDFLQSIGLLAYVRHSAWRGNGGVTQLLHALAVINIDTNAIALSCFPSGLMARSISLSYTSQWLLIAALPLLLLAASTVFTVLRLLLQRIVFGRLQAWNVPLIRSLTNLAPLFYLYYLPALYHGLSAFDCQELDRSDGLTYMPAVGVAGGACYTEGSVQQQLQPWAILVILSYSMLLFVYLLTTCENTVSCHRCAAPYLDRLRLWISIWRMNLNNKSPDLMGLEMEEENTLNSSFMSNFSRNSVYFSYVGDFKGDFELWVFVVLFRKIFLVVSVVFLQSNLPFLFTVYMSIFLWSFVLQSRFSPYLPSLSQSYEALVSNHLDALHKLSPTSTSLYVFAEKKSLLRRWIEWVLSKPALAALCQTNALESSLLLLSTALSAVGVLVVSDILPDNAIQMACVLFLFLFALAMSHACLAVTVECLVALNVSFDDSTSGNLFRNTSINNHSSKRKSSINMNRVHSNIGLFNNFMHDRSPSRKFPGDEVDHQLPLPPSSDRRRRSGISPQDIIEDVDNVLSFYQRRGEDGIFLNPRFDTNHSEDYDGLTNDGVIHLHDVTNNSSKNNYSEDFVEIRKPKRVDLPSEQEKEENAQKLNKLKMLQLALAERLIREQQEEIRFLKETSMPKFLTPKNAFLIEEERKNNINMSFGGGIAREDVVLSISDGPLITNNSLLL